MSVEYKSLREQFDAWIETCPVEYEFYEEHDGEPGERCPWYFFRIPKEEDEK